MVTGPCMIGPMNTCVHGVTGGWYTPLSLHKDELLSLHVYVDGGIIEVIANGRRVLTSSVLPPSDDYNQSALLLSEGSALKSW